MLSESENKKIITKAEPNMHDDEATQWFHDVVEITDLSYVPLPIYFAQVITGPNAGEISTNTRVWLCI